MVASMWHAIRLGSRTSTELKKTSRYTFAEKLGANVRLDGNLSWTRPHAGKKRPNL